MTSSVEVERAGPVARVWLNRPELRNAFDDASIAELTQAFAALSTAAGVRVVVLAGRGKAFCAGADLGWMRRMAGFSWEQNRADAEALAAMLWAVYSCPVPVVGRIHGDCYAGGVGLAAVCDVLVAAETATFCLSEARLGLLPATIGPYVVRALGQQASRRYFTTAERFSAAHAHALGFVHELCAPEALDAAVDAIVAALVNNGPTAVRACKQLVADVAGVPIDAGLRADTARRIADIRASDEGREGVRSFLEKRKPAWLIDVGPAPAATNAADRASAAADDAGGRPPQQTMGAGRPPAADD
ncbi:MAG: enoyl-CoA hydratase/isomerase family protein [Rhizobacter sp.]